MERTRVILGYGVPKSMPTDVNNQLYLRTVFNQAYDDLLATGFDQAIYCSGGPTDMWPPYRRTEADVMVKELRRFSKVLPPNLRRKYRFIAERKSMSTLENLLNVKKMIRRKQSLIIYCEWTRFRRVQRLSRLVLGLGWRIVVRGVDFDASSNRYLNPKLIANKEKRALRFDTWSLQSAHNLREHHQLFLEKVRFLRSRGPQNHVAAVREWYEHSVQILRKKFPDLPELP